MTIDPTAHALAPPWHLPGDRDERLTDYLRDEEWGHAVTLLRDVVSETTTTPKWLLLLAYSRFRDACDVMFDERLPAAQEALALIDRAVAGGLPLNEVSAFREEVENVLDEETRAELAVLAQLPDPGQPLDSVPLDVLTDAAFLLWAGEPERAGTLFEEVARRSTDTTPELALTASIRAGLCFNDAKQFERAEPLLERSLTADWSLPRLREERSLAETALTALMLHASGTELEALWVLASVSGERLKLPFPSVWPNQEVLLRRLSFLREFSKARLVASRIEETRDTLPRTLIEAIAKVRLEES